MENVDWQTALLGAVIFAYITSSTILEFIAMFFLINIGLFFAGLI